MWKSKDQDAGVPSALIFVLGLVVGLSLYWLQRDARAWYRATPDTYYDQYEIVQTFPEGVKSSNAWLGEAHTVLRNVATEERIAVNGVLGKPGDRVRLQYSWWHKRF